MKKKILIFTLIAGASVSAFATYAGIYSWPFSAPAVSDEASVPGHDGDILYNETDDQFYGFRGGSWLPMTGSSASSLNVSPVKTSNYTLVSTDDIVLANGTSGSFTLTLPSAGGTNSGKVFRIKRTDQTLAQVITIDGDLSETIDGSLTTSLNTAGETLTIVSDGANWEILERRIPGTIRSYSPGEQGFGATSKDCNYSRTGRHLNIDCKFVASAVTGSEARVDLPSGLVSADTSVLATIHLAGFWTRIVANGEAGTVLIEPSKTYVTFGVQNSTNGGLNKRLANGIIGSGDTMVFNAKVPIQGWVD